MALSAVLVLLVNLVVIQAGTEVGPEGALKADLTPLHLDVYATAIAKAHYNPWFCNYFKEPGYRCRSCSSALHCYPGNFALLIQCAGRLPYCSNGYCSATRAERCSEDSSHFKEPDTQEIKPAVEQDDEKIEIENPNIDIGTSTNTAEPKRDTRRYF